MDCLSILGKCILTRVGNKQIKQIKFARFSLVTTFIGLVLLYFREFDLFDLFIANSDPDIVEALGPMNETGLINVLTYYSYFHPSLAQRPAFCLQNRTFTEVIHHSSSTVSFL